MKKLFSMMAMVLLCVAAMARGDKFPEYDITGAGSATEGTVLVKVYVYGMHVSDEDLKRAAVHGVVFRGFANTASRVQQPAMASPTAEADNQSYCDAFFARDGMCQNYAQIVSGSYDRVKTKKGMKCGATVQVNKSALRKELEKGGVVRSLSSGF
ncbi:MAG: hypothetical protein IJV22_05195 [Bacteroidales bacterium]|nr:hypothetical protein [Bacteroidales bacterium]